MTLSGTLNIASHKYDTSTRTGKPRVNPGGRVDATLTPQSCRKRAVGTRCRPGAARRDTIITQQLYTVVT